MNGYETTLSFFALIIIYDLVSKYMENKFKDRK